MTREDSVSSDGFRSNLRDFNRGLFFRVADRPVQVPAISLAVRCQQCVMLDDPQLGRLFFCFISM